MSVLSLDDLKSVIRFDSAASDPELQEVLNVAESVVAARVLAGSGMVLDAAAYALHPDLKLAVGELTRHLWRPRRGPSARGDQPATPGYAGALPTRVRELLEPYDPGVTFA